MKKLLLGIFLPALMTLFNACVSSGPVNPEPSPTPQPDVVLNNDETGAKSYGPASTDLERCDLLRRALKEAKPADTILLGAGKFDCDGKNKGTVLFPNLNAVVGKGMDLTHIYSNNYGDGQGAGFEIQNGTYSDLTFENQSWQVNEDGRTLEIYPGLKRTPDNKEYAHDEAGNKIVEQAVRGPYAPVLERVKVVGNAWTIYDWDTQSLGHFWTIRDSLIVSGRHGVSLMCGGGRMPSALIERTTFDIDTRRSADIGWTSNREVGGGYGVVSRGTDNGASKRPTRIIDSVFKMRCGESGHAASFVPRCVGVYDGHGFGSASSGWNYIEIINPTFEINGNGSKDVYDIHVTNTGAREKLKVVGGKGSGPNGEVTIVPMPSPSPAPLVN